MITKGYVRLRCVDEPVIFRKPLDVPRSSSSDFGYAHEPVYNKPYSDGVSEAMSSDGSPIHSGTTSDEDDAFDKEFRENLKNAKPFALQSKDKLTNKTSNELNGPSTSKAAFSNPSSRSKAPRIQIPVPHFESNVRYNILSSLFVSVNTIPMSLFTHATTPVLEGSYPMRPFDSLGSLHPYTKPGRILNHNHHSRSSPSLTDTSRDSQSPFKDMSSAGSGYESISISTRSRASSIASELVRDKWQKLNLKKLWEFGKKTRKDEIQPGVRYEPIPDNCYSEIKYEFSYDDADDDDDDEEEEEESSGEENETDDDQPYGYLEGGKKKKRRNDDEDYEMRFYLNSLQVSSNTCSEFHYIAPQISIPPSSITQGVVLGTTIRCPLPYRFQKEHEEEDDLDMENYYVTHTFTPSLHSKSWPKGLYFRFNQQIFSIIQKQGTRGEMWPSRAQMEQIELSGCNAIPLGYRSMDFFNAEQILEWELNFQEAEINLLNSFRCPQWRAYMFAATIFRAFIAPLGPQGIGLEHIRNILYFMCHDDFSGWNDEQPGAHLKAILDKLFFFLSKSNMPSFFIRSRNLLQSIPEQNLRFVQGHLNKIRENLIIYSIYAFRNLMDVRKTKASYSFPNFQNLFEMLTVPEGELLKIQNPVLQMEKDQEDEKLREEAKLRAKKKMKGKKRHHDLLHREESIDKEFFTTVSTIHQEKQARAHHHHKRDKLNEKLWRDYRKYESKLKIERQKEKEKLKHDPDHRLPEHERRKSIDLKKMPMIREQFTPFRLLLIIQFFIKQFIEMAEKAYKMKSYGPATMYVIQVENLCEIVEDDKYKETISPFQDDDLDEYREKTLRLRALLARDSHQYILARLTVPPSSPSGRYTSEPMSPTLGSFPTFTNNWDLRKLPTPPSSEKNIQPSGKVLQKPNISSTLQSLPNQNPEPTIPPTLPPVLPSPTRVPVRRQESIKFVSSEPPATPPRPRSSAPPSRSVSRQSINLSFDHGEDSTDL
ncbi:hypothetical protein Ocin01_06027 [Orchesella cincta]|uniref:Mab-21-like HhH/H2TH-like domain-containing protein n=1 Tax=Orchesella cincta TaxID=48709 RepID=A0A1D2N6F0_ORCCI|nr:hypothetical protein Ocin01_06027 [Orchesella cincta]